MIIILYHCLILERSPSISGLLRLVSPNTEMDFLLQMTSIKVSSYFVKKYLLALFQISMMRVILKILRLCFMVYLMDQLLLQIS